MSTTSEYERTVQQDYGPTTSNENIYEHVFDHKLIQKMDVSNVRPQVLRAVPLSPTQGDPEPDSTNPESIIRSVHKIDNKDIKYHIKEKRYDTDMSVDSLSRIVHFEETNIDNVSRLPYPIIQGTDDSGDGNYGESTATLIQTPLNAAIVHNVTKLPQNFTINVDAAVGNITALQNVSQDVTGNQTLWLPTILTTSGSDNKNEENRQSGVSQIIITSESYLNDTNQTNRRGNIITEASYIGRPKASKVQILSNISLPKNTNYSQQYVAQSKEISAPVYGPQNHVYKLSANLVPTKHVNNNMLSTKPPKNPAPLINATTMTQTVINSSPVKNVPYSHTYTKSTNLNKVNNGANLNAIVAASSSNTHCHILSRVVSGPNKLSVHSGRRTNALKSSKNSQNSGQSKNQRSIKIIQQAGNASKSENKAWPVANVTYKGQSNYNVETNTSMVIQKIGSPTHKPHPQPIALQKVPKGERLVLQSPCGPVLISTAPLSTSLPKGPHYVQSGSTPNLQYVQTYGPDNQLSTVPQISANQQLTAQILQSLSQPKLIIHQSPTALTPVKSSISPIFGTFDDRIETKPANPKRIVFGDKSTLMTADDIIGVEERPNLSEELRRYSFQPLALVMLDHTYALAAQKLAAPSTPTKTEVSTSPKASTPPITSSTPISPLKRNSPTVITSVSNDTPSTVTTTAIAAPVVATLTSPIGSLPFKPQPPPPQDDDNASIISSVEGERRPPAPGGSDTETAPEGEEEGKTRCICDFTHDDGYMICCDRCGEWQHVDCMGIDRNNIPDAYMCELCLPRTIDRRHARIIQLRKREELSALAGSDSDSSEIPTLIPGQRRKRLLTVTTYTNTSGSCVTTYNSSLPVLPPLPQPSLTLPKRGPKRPKKTEILRKGTKRKLSEKRVKRKKELMFSKNKYNTSISSQSHWRDTFELAMTNHYSPELRAKIMKYSNKLGNTSNMASAITAHLCTTVPHAGGKILIATKDLKENTPVIELRGKYMLSNQHRPQLQNSARAGSQKPGPFVFFYRLPKDNTQICIDTRTYGNEARFVRRSCKPNAELQHCIVKGALHVYLATITDIPSNTEITVGHDTNGSKQPCACGNPKHCKVNGLNTLPRKSIDYTQREKRSRNRCLSASSPISPPPTVTTPVKEMSPPFTPIKTEIKMEKKSPIKHEFPPMSPPKESYVPFHYNEPIKSEPLLDLKSENQEFDLTAKEEMKADFDEPDSVKSEVEDEAEKSILIIREIPMPITPEPEPEPELIKPKEVKMEEEIPTVIKSPEPIMPIAVLVPDKIIEEPIKEEEKEIIEEAKIEEERPITREFMAKSACHDRSSRSSRTCSNQANDSLDDKTDDSQDKIQTAASKEKEKRKMTREERKMEAIMKAFERMEKAQQRKQEVRERQKRRESDPHPTNLTEREDEDDFHCSIKKRKRRKGRARTASQSNRRRLNSADSDMMTSGDEAPHGDNDTHDTLDASDTIDAPAPHRVSLNEDIGLSSACLLVEAAVGSVESAFKLPKTKKTMVNEWMGRSPERTPSPYHSPYRPTLVSAPSLENLVRVASTMIGDLSGSQEFQDEPIKSPPRTPGREKNRPPKKAKRVTRSTPTIEVPEIVPAMQHSAKKRWLRQAISEESDSPIAESPPSEMVTPLKKRRLARESLSCDLNPIIMPSHEGSSPSLALEDSPVKDDSLSLSHHYKHNIMDLYSRDRTRSDSGQGSDDQCNIDHDILNVNIKGLHDSENIRRIIGVPPTPEEEQPAPVLTKPEDIQTINNNNLELEESNYNKVVPMDIDTTVITQTKIESNENSNEVKGLESPNDKVNSSQSADTSGNSSPQRDEMDDIQKKIHSFHTENILILKSRNKKPPKEKRKKVNLNFDLNMVDDQISVQLRTEHTSPKCLEVNGGDAHDANSHEDVKLHVSPENIPLPPVESIPLPPPPEHIPLPEEISAIPTVPPPETIPLPAEPMKPNKPPLKPKKVVSPPPVAEKQEDKEVDRPSVLENSTTLPFSTRFSSTGLFSGIFSNMSNTFKIDSSINDNIPNLSIIKSAIDRTTSLDGRLFEKDSIKPVDDLKSVQEILTRVNNMDSNNSVLLSGVLRGTKPAVVASPVRVPAQAPAAVPSAAPAPVAPSSVRPVSPAPPAHPVRPARTYCSRVLDPRLNPPPVDKPKPVRRKLSISEYRLRQLGAAGGGEEGGSGAEGSGGEAEAEGEWSRSSGSASLSPQRLEAAAAAAADDLEQRLHRDLSTQLPAGVFDAQPTASERQREDLSSRLRREFGLALPDEEPPHPSPTDHPDSARRAR